MAGHTSIELLKSESSIEDAVKAAHKTLRNMRRLEIVPRHNSNPTQHVIE